MNDFKARVMSGLCICGNPDCAIQYGECHCGCKRMAPLGTMTNIGGNILKGFPVRYLRGHSRAKSRVDFSMMTPFDVEGVMCRLISLTRGQVSIVNEAKWEELSTWLWHASWNIKSQRYYAQRNSPRVNNKTGLPIPMHRHLLGLAPEDEREGDHINGITLDNRIENLRVCTSAENNRNRRISRNNTSGFLGVSYDKKANKWRAQIEVNGVNKRLGVFDTPEEAYIVYCRAAVHYFGEFTRVSV